MIQSPEDLPAFAQNLYALFIVFLHLLELLFTRLIACLSVKKTPEEQTELLAKLDAHGAARTG